MPRRDEASTHSPGSSAYPSSGGPSSRAGGWPGPLVIQLFVGDPEEALQADPAHGDEITAVGLADENETNTVHDAGNLDLPRVPAGLGVGDRHEKVFTGGQVAVPDGGQKVSPHSSFVVS